MNIVVTTVTCAVKCIKPSGLEPPSSNAAKRFNTHDTRDSRTLILSMDDNQKIIEEFQGIKLCWTACEHVNISTSFSYYPASDETRQLKLYTNNAGGDRCTSSWSHVAFQHSTTYQTLAMDPRKKEDIINCLDKFIQGKEYYNGIGKAWKRGCLIYGPPGTGKSTMIYAMANHLKYDIYDLELTAVKDNADLRKLLIKISNKSIIVV
nr:AAA-ATPase ASD, mitochondrial-like [Ziziphus jujuba var. spinosa]